MDDAIATDSPACTARELAGIARRLFVDGPLIKRKLQHYRPYICPFGELIRFVPQQARVLDIGCGGGLFLGLLHATRQITGCGFDSSAAAIAVAKGMADRTTPRDALRFELVAAEHDWPAFDANVVSIVDVMHHIPPPVVDSVLKRAFDRVPPGGRLIYKDMCRRPFWKAAANRLHDLLLARQWIHYVDRDHVIDLARSNGLEPIHRADITCGVYGHELVVFTRHG